MKSKKSIYILLPLVLLIWGILGYQLFSFFGNEEEPTENDLTFQVQNTTYKAPDSVKIVVDYRDPFSGKLSDGNNSNKLKTSNLRRSKTETVLTNKEENKPIIIYRGLVSDTKEKNKVFMFSVDNKTYLLEKGQTENDIKVISGDTKQITLLINKKKEVVAISK